MGWTSLAPKREVVPSAPRRPTPDRRPRRTNDGALAHDPVLRLAAWLRSTPLRARRPKAAYGCGSAPVSDRLPQTAGVKWSNAPTCTAEQSSHAGFVASARTAANWSTIQSRSAAAIAIGGGRRTVDPWVSLARTPTVYYTHLRAHE